MKGMDLQGGCSVCGNHEETTNHVIFQCKLSQDVWYMVYPRLLEYAERIAGQANFWQSIFDLMIREVVLEKCMVTFWQIWFNRNKCLHDHYCRTPITIAASVDRLLEEFK